MKVNEWAGLGNHNTALDWEYGTREGKRLNRDTWNPNPSISPYIVFDDNPILKNDPLGNLPPSTHTDANGNVVQVNNDNDLGVYKHDNLKNWDGNSTLPKTGPGVTKMGETWTPYGFANFSKYQKTHKLVPAEKAKIDFGFTWATKQVGQIIGSHPDALEYVLRAKSGGVWDIKSHTPNGSPMYGSLLFGKYASARDAGNMAAGAVAQLSLAPNSLFDYGFGVYNMTGNNIGKTAFTVVSDLMILGRSPMQGAAIMSNRAANGEDKLSQQGIDAGKMLMQKIMNGSIKIN